MGAKLERALGVLNGTIGDHLARTGNGLATEMRCVKGGLSIPLERAALERAYPTATGRVALLLHGVMGTERDFVMADGGDYGALLARDLGFTPVYVRYNSGRAIEASGADLAALIRRLVEAYPVPLEEIMPVGYSMGGLVARSALHAATLAGEAWPARVRRAVYVGSPHRGAPMERWGRVAAGLLHAAPDPVVRLIGRIGDLRSAGVKDLGDPHPAPLAAGVRHLLVAGAISGDPTLGALLGDTVVPLASATDGRHGDGATVDESQVHVRHVHGVSHVALAHHPRVYERIREWCLEDEAVAATPITPLNETANATPIETPTPIASAAEASQEAARDERLRGLAALARDAVEHGSRAVERVQVENARRSFALLEAIPPLAAPARLVRAAHDASVAGTHAAIRLVNRLAGRALDAAR